MFALRCCGGVAGDEVLDGLPKGEQAGALAARFRMSFIPVSAK